MVNRSPDAGSAEAGAEASLLVLAEQRAMAHYAGKQHPAGLTWLEHARGVVAILRDLGVDDEAQAAAMLLGADLSADRETLKESFGNTVVELVDATVAMGKIQLLRGRIALVDRRTERNRQLDVLRKMLLAMAQDIRVVLIKLADQLQILRALTKDDEAPGREDCGRENLELFAPLANWMGVGQLKWELEDLAFQCLQPGDYRRLADELDENRPDREAYLREVVERLHGELDLARIAGTTSGRPKHLYSIWRKMQRKNLSLTQLSDIRAVRVLVDSVQDCYAVLGLVHDLWAPISGEFDDYIARPKANGYASLHTAVTGPGGKVVEVQIRTQEMHRRAELGFAAHWRYKQDASADAAFDQKIAWLRRILSWGGELASGDEADHALRAGLFDDHVYVLTPQGNVIDLPRGSTPVDFAYRVHTELGHRCRGAKVDGRIVPLTQALETGQRVEIIAAKAGGPSRDWLRLALGYLASPRARTKVRQWFNTHELENLLAEGRAVIEREFQRSGKTGQNLDTLARRLKFASVEEFLVACGRGEVAPGKLHDLVAEGMGPHEAGKPFHHKLPDAGSGAILIVGVDHLLTALARCCRPAPPDRIIGFVTRGRGVTVHRAGCRNAARLPAARLIEAAWGSTGTSRFVVDVEIIANGGETLMRAIGEILTKEKTAIVSSTQSARGPHSRIALGIEVDGLEQLHRVLSQIGKLPDVEVVRRK
ncbi:MAG: RelA/SpoT family protein [Burkholderiales bacterium]